MQVRAVILTPEGFTADNGLLTPTFKIRRNEVRDTYRADIATAYAAAGEDKGAAAAAGAKAPPQQQQKRK
jgi:long-chain acyl-CoA synthetase